jgi:enterochelin esterase family protein
MKAYLKTLILLAWACAAHGQLSSPRLDKLRDAAMKDPSAVADFWNEISRTGTPMVEEINGTEDLLVTFLLRSDAVMDNAVVFASVLPENNPDRQRLRRLVGTDVWFHTSRFHRDVPILYEISDDGPQKLQRDPMNPRFIDGPMGGSVVLPRGRSQPGAFSGNETAGRVEEVTFSSKLLGNDRKVAVYLPPGFRPDHAYSLVTVLDEDIFNGPVKLPSILDDLIDSRKLQPMVVAMVGNVSRAHELSCNAAFSGMPAEELIPWVKRRLGRRRTTIVGASLGGLAAACAGFQASNAFDSVIALSASLRWHPDGDPEPEWLARRIAAAPAVPVRFSISVGSFETGLPLEAANPSLLTAARHLRDVLQARGYRLRYREFPGAHEPLSWSLNIGEALVASQKSTQ